MTPTTAGPGTRLATFTLTAATLAVATIATPLTTPLVSPVVGTAHAAPVDAADHGTVGIALADTPPAHSDDPRSGRYIVGHLDPGRTLTRRVRVTNDTAATQQLQLYAGPATVEGGRFLPGEPGAANTLTRWITVDPPVARVPPGGSTLVTVTITAPANAPTREHYGVIWASHTSAASRDAGGQPTGVDLVSRVGVRVYLSTGEGRPADPDFEIIDLRPIRDVLGAAALVATVVNIGGRALDLGGTLELTEGPGGLTAPPLPAEPVTLAPGDSAEVPFRLPSDAVLPPGEWRATLDLASGSVRREVDRAVGLEPDHVSPVSTAEGRDAPSGRIAVAAAALAVLAASLGAWWAVIRRRP
ncbi:hypothetical protein [Dietzia sp. CH92]|uniref:hypothetical protein n=1 Tax=Dietzia sp. CH92 TaxID=3051823 RepID=UPI0028D81E2D|nr:hypothetical protein [Dietzia sp. CH92]